eukprot:2422276-Pleurochrysis_carterae.AAC.1
MSLSNYAKENLFSRYNTGEPHPLDDDGALLEQFVDPTTRWTMYRYKAEVVQPKDGKDAYVNAEEAIAQRELARGRAGCRGIRTVT